MRSQLSKHCFYSHSSIFNILTWRTLPSHSALGINSSLNIIVCITFAVNILIIKQGWFLYLKWGQSSALIIVCRLKRETKVWPHSLLIPYVETWSSFFSNAAMKSSITKITVTDHRYKSNYFPEKYIVRKLHTVIVKPQNLFTITYLLSLYTFHYVRSYAWPQSIWRNVSQGWTRHQIIWYTSKTTYSRVSWS